MADSQLPPGPRGHFLLGNLNEFRGDTLRFLLDIRAYGDVALLRFGPFNALVLNHPDLFHQVMVTDADKFYKSDLTKLVLSPVVGEGLFTSDGEFWKRQRRLAQPAFHTRRIGAYAQVMTDYTLAMLDAWRSGATYDIDREMTALTMSIITKTLFDADVSDEAREIGDVITTVLSIVNERFNALLLAPEWLPTKNNRRMRESVVRLDQIIQRFIDERRKSGVDKGDLLTMLLLARDDENSQMTDKQVRDEAMTLFGAGHETTANALTWAFYTLSQHPEVEAKLLAELDAVLGGRAPTFEDLPRLTYTEQVIKETLRLYPPAWGTSRQAIEPVTVGGVPMRQGMVALINIWGVHRDARFFPDPERFDPERFSPENEKRIPKYAYLPFGAGPRVCIGNAFAMMEAKLILATVAPRFKLTLAPGHQVVPERVFTLRSKYGMRMVAAERQPVPVQAVL